MLGQDLSNSKGKKRLGLIVTLFVSFLASKVSRKKVEKKEPKDLEEVRKLVSKMLNCCDE